MHIIIIINEIINVITAATGIKKKGIKGINPPKNGDPPFTKEITILAKLSAFSYKFFLFGFLRFILSLIFDFFFCKFNGVIIAF